MPVTGTADPTPAGGADWLHGPPAARARRVTALAAMLAAGCSSSGHPGPPSSATPRPSASSPAPAGAVLTDWPTYHQNAQRTGNVPGLPAAGPLSLAWSTSLGAEVAGQPAVWGSPVLGGGALFVAQPYDGNLYEVAPATGKVARELHIASRLPDFVSPSLSGALVLVGTLDGVVAVRGA
jgi:hypothetical protein